MPRLPFLFLALMGACAGAEPPARPVPTRVADKHALYGDPVLVPTREGERVRREVALATEIEAAVEVALDTSRAVADVELGDTPPRVSVALRLSGPDPDPAATRATVEALARAIVKGAEVHVLAAETGSADAEPIAPERPSTWLALALLGLGISLGITIERLRLRSVRRRRR